MIVNMIRTILSLDVLMNDCKPSDLFQAKREVLSQDEIIVEPLDDCYVDAAMLANQIVGAETDINGKPYR